MKKTIPTRRLRFADTASIGKLPVATNVRGQARKLHGGERRIHPIIMYPFRQPKDTRHIVALYERLKEIQGSDPEKYFKPITVLNRQTLDRVVSHQMSEVEIRAAREKFKSFIKDRVEPNSEVVPAWCVDTCQMWLTGLGKAYDTNQAVAPVYWLIPGDFEYDSPTGKQVLARLPEIPLRIYSERNELCLGEIKVPLNSAKQLIDTYGTYGLLYNWFPSEAQAIREITDKPRTEFIAIDNSYLRHVLSQRWYGYEQTIVILLHGIAGLQQVRKIVKVELGAIQDDDSGRSRLEGAMQQVERTERVLKLFWRERNTSDRNWRDKFRRLDSQSEQVRSAAMIILEQILA